MKVTSQRVVFFAALCVAFAAGLYSREHEVATLTKQKAAYFDQLIECQLKRGEAAEVNLAFMAEVIPIIVKSIEYQIPADMAAAILKEAEKHNFDPDMVFKMIEVESGFRPNVTSSAGAVGLMQVRTIAAREVGYDVGMGELKNIRTNIHIGLVYLAYLEGIFDGDLRLALLAYNRGPGTVNRYLARRADPSNGYAARIVGD